MSLFITDTGIQCIFGIVGHIKITDFRTGNTTVILDSPKLPLHLDHHYREKFLYWTDFGKGTLSRSA